MFPHFIDGDSSMSLQLTLLRQRFSLRNFKLSTKITTAFLIVATVVCIVGGMGIWALGQVDQQAQNLGKGSFTRLQHMAAIQTDVLNIKGDLLLAEADITFSGTQILLSQIKVDEDLLQKDWAAFKSSVHSTLETTTIAEYQIVYTQWDATLQKLMTLVTEKTPISDSQAKIIITNRWEDQSTELLKPLATLVAIQVQQGHIEQATITNTYTQMLWVISIGMVLAVTLAVLLGRFITSIVVTPLRAIAEVVQLISQGELNEITSLVTKFGGRDAMGTMVIALNDAIICLRALIGNFTKMSGRLTATSDSIAESALQTNSSTEQVTQTIQQVAIGAQDQSSQLGTAAEEVDMLAQQSLQMQIMADETIKIMDTLKQEIETTAQKMTSLAVRSDQIGKIVQTINDLADQTNLLALNAAIEAARAGEQGRGFAVVADEVRKLAERSAAATQEIRSVITTMQSETHQAVAAMKQGVAQVDIGVTRVVAADGAARAMAQRVQRVNQAIVMVASVSEENSAAAQEVTSATGEMTAQVSDMVTSITSIKTIAEDLQKAALVFHWEYADNWQERGMRPSDDAPFHPVPATDQEESVLEERFLNAA